MSPEEIVSGLLRHWRLTTTSVDCGLDPEEPRYGALGVLDRVRLMWRKIKMSRGVGGSHKSRGLRKIRHHDYSLSMMLPVPFLYVLTPMRPSLNPVQSVVPRDRARWVQENMV